MRLLSIAWSAGPIVAILLTISSVASAQQPPKKKKKPKKPKTEQPADPPPDDADQPASLLRKDDDSAPKDPPDKAPPKLDTNLKETGSTNASTESNPWLLSGAAKRKDGSGAPVAESDSHQDRKKPIDTTGSKPLAITAQGGYASNNLRIGFGAKIGYEFLQSIYIGAGFVYHLGTSVGPLTLSAFYPAAEIGYDVHFENVTIRPYTGFGMLFFHVSGGDSPVSNGANSFFTLYPGVQLDYQIPDNAFFIGVDARALFVFGANDYGQSIGVFGVGGARF